MKLFGNIRQWLSVLAGKPQVQVEDYVLEHLLAYHGLIGTGTNEQPGFAELATAIKNAVVQQSAAQLDTALKVPPLWWDEHLKPVFDEIIHTESEKLHIVLAAHTNEPDLLASDDWRVRANAANVLAALCKYKNNQAFTNAIEQRLTRVLAESINDPFKAAFLHLSYALGMLRTQTTHSTLLGYLHDPEPWFRVDAARALTLFPAQESARDVLVSLLDYHQLLDYQAMVIARAYDIQELLQMLHDANVAADADMQEGLYELILGVEQAAKQPAFAQLIEETKEASCLPQLLAPNPVQCSARHIRAVLQLAQWLAARNALGHAELESFVQFRHKLASPEFIQSMKRQLANISKITRESDIKHTVALVGELHLSQLAPQMILLLNPDFVALDETINSLAQLADVKAAAPLIKLAQQLVDLDERTGRPASPQPVVESNAAAAKSYWLILKVLGRLRQSDSLEFLCRAAYDFAPDKRAEAVRSLISVCSGLSSRHGEHSMHGHGDKEEIVQTSQIKNLFKQALQDSSSEVRKAALQGVAELRISDLLPYVRKNCAAKERSLSEAAFAVFGQLYSQGLSELVLTELRRGGTWTLNSNLRRRYAQLAASLTG